MIKAPALNRYLELVEQRQQIADIRQRYIDATQKRVRIVANALISIDGQDINDPLLNEAITKTLTADALMVIQDAIAALDAMILAARSHAQAEYDNLFAP